MDDRPRRGIGGSDRKDPEAELNLFMQGLKGKATGLASVALQRLVALDDPGIQSWLTEVEEHARKIWSLHHTARWSDVVDFINQLNDDGVISEADRNEVYRNAPWYLQNRMSEQSGYDVTITPAQYVECVRNAIQTLRMMHPELEASIDAMVTSSQEMRRKGRSTSLDSLGKI